MTVPSKAGHARIRQAMRKNEALVMQWVRKANKDGELFYTGWGLSNALYNALDRLVAKGRVIERRHRGFFGYALKGVRIGKRETK